MFEAIGRAIVAPDRPLVLTIDDLHWCDADSLDLLEFVVRFGLQSTSPLLVVGAARDEEVATQPRLRPMIRRLHDLEAMLELPLHRLDTSAAAIAAHQLLGGDATDATVERLVTAAEGNPLFLVELARSGLLDRSPASATDSLPSLPPRIQSVIEARLDKLPGPTQSW